MPLFTSKELQFKEFISRLNFRPEVVELLCEQYLKVGDLLDKDFMKHFIVKEEIHPEFWNKILLIF